MKINSKNCPLPLSKAFINIIEKEMNLQAMTQPKQQAITEQNDIIINFRDTNYSAENGGFHPVEVYILANGTIQYITDFAYVGGGGHEELVKEIDFDFSLNLFQHFSHEYPIRQGKDMYTIWQQNFVSYHQMGVYQTTVTNT